MSNGIEIYVRPSGGRWLLNLYVPEAMRDRFLRGVQSGTVDGALAEINLEFDIHSDWVSDKMVADQLASIGPPIHVRIPIAAINTQFIE